MLSYTNNMRRSTRLVGKPQVRYAPAERRKRLRVTVTVKVRNFGRGGTMRNVYGDAILDENDHTEGYEISITEDIWVRTNPEPIPQNTVRSHLTGLFKYIAPVCDVREDIVYEDNAALHSLCGGNKFELTVCRRADKAFFALCKDVDAIDVAQFPVNELTMMNLCYYHVTRIKVNTDCESAFIRDKSTASPYSCTGPWPQLPCASAALALDLENENCRQRLDENQNLLAPRVQLNEYYNFGRIGPGRHGCFFGLENGHLRPPIIIFSRCAALVKAAP